MSTDDKSVKSPLDSDEDINPDEHIRPNQRHADSAEFLSMPTRIPKRDRNGQPTDDGQYNTSEAFTVTLKGLMQIRAIETRKVKRRLDDQINGLQAQVDHLTGEVKKAREKSESLAAQLQVVNREANEVRVQGRIRDAVASAIETAARENAALRAQCADLRSENTELRESKRRLKMSRGGRA